MPFPARVDRECSQTPRIEALAVGDIVERTLVETDEPVARMIEAVRRALSATGYPALRNLDVEYCRDTVVLWGRVPSYHQKQLAQVIVQRVNGVRGIANGLEVVCRSFGVSR